jgi:hypothetical protein
MRDRQAAPAGSPPVIRQYDLRAALPPHLAAWLEAHCAHPVFGTPDWFAQLANFQEELRPPATAYRWLVVYQDDLPLLAAPIEQTRRFGQLQLKLFSNFYTPSIDLLVDRSRITQSQAWSYLLWAFDQTYPGWLSFRAMPLTVAQEALLASVGSARHATFSYPVSANYTATIGDIGAYWKARPSRLSHTLARKRKQLNKRAHRFAMVAAPSAEQVAGYWTIYQHSWKHQEPSRSFISWLLTWSAQRGYLRLGLLYVDEEVVASQLWLVVGRTACIFKLAQDMNANKLSPGSLLTEHMINAAVLHDRVDKIDFLLGDDQFKALWMDGKQPIYWVEVINRKSLVGLALGLVYGLKNRFKRRFGRDPAAV